jgi:hypothetical protein
MKNKAGALKLKFALAIAGPMRYKMKHKNSRLYKIVGSLSKGIIHGNFIL